VQEVAPGFAVMTSSVRQDWPTARGSFAWLDDEFQFTLDACASPENAKVDRYYTERDEGLMRSWQGERVFVNPPYGKQLPKWIAKCWNEAGHAEVIVALIPARVDTAAWHDYIFGHAEIRFLRGRMRFEGSGNDCPFPVAVVVWRPPLELSTAPPYTRITEAANS
jgi:site-specific DNA-methyltransferase (adenine-specific)